MKYDDIVIGGGVSGLSSAVLLAQNGRRVCILEQSSHIAPTIRGFVRDGIYFDTGFHYGTLFGEGEPFGRLCERLGIMSGIEVSRYGNSGGDCLYSVEGDFTFDFKSGLENFTGQLIDLFGDEREAIVEFGSRIRVFLDRLNNSFFDMVMNPPGIFENGNGSLYEYLEANFKSTQLKTILSSYAMLYGSMPEETSIDYHSMICGAYFDKSWQVVEGGRAITDAFSAKLAELGVTVRTRSSVDRILVDDSKKVEAVSLKDGATIECDNCVFTGHPRTLTGMLPEGTFRPVYQGRLDDLSDTFSAVVVYCENGDSEGQGDFNNIILVHKPFPNMFVEGGGFSNRPMYISRSVSDKYSGGISIICPCSFGEVEKWGDSVVGDRAGSYYEWKKETAESIIGVAMKYCADKLGDLRILDVATPLTFRDYMNAPNGCLYGAKHRTVDMPILPRTRVKGLYLSGQKIISAGVMGAMVAGFVTAAAITGEDYRQALV